MPIERYRSVEGSPSPLINIIPGIAVKVNQKRLIKAIFETGVGKGRATGYFSEAANMIQSFLKNLQTTMDFPILIMYLWPLSKLS